MSMSPVQDVSRLGVAHSRYAEDKSEICCVHNPGYISWQSFPIQKLFVAEEMPREMCCLKLYSEHTASWEQQQIHACGCLSSTTWEF